jgi:hypothetical protein
MEAGKARLNVTRVKTILTCCCGFVHTWEIFPGEE